MIILQIIAWILIVAAFLVVGEEAYVWAVSGSFHVHALGELWYSLNRESLNLFQAGVQRHLSPWLWDHAIQPVLLMPAWMVLGVPGVCLRVLIGLRSAFVATAQGAPRKPRSFR